MRSSEVVRVRAWVRARALAWSLVASALLASCAGRLYRPGSLLGSTEPSTRIGCIELSIRGVYDAPAIPASNPVVEVAFGNRCTSPMPLDFRRMVATGIYGDGRWPLEVFDPRHTIVAGVLDGHRTSYERFELVPDAAHSEGPDSVCLAFRDIAPATHPEMPTELCVQRHRALGGMRS